MVLIKMSNLQCRAELLNDVTGAIQLLLMLLEAVKLTKQTLTVLQYIGRLVFVLEYLLHFLHVKIC